MTEMATPPKFDSRDALCSQIDKVLIEFFSVLTDLYKEQELLNDQLKSGFLNMSRSRYSMGIKSVGISQCNENKMTASMRVTVEEPDHFLLENVSQLTDIENKLGNLNMDNAENENGDNVRRRNVTKKDTESDVETVGLKEKTSGKEIKANTPGKVFDPIKWFGVLVPPALRQSQKDFRTSVSTVVAIANLQRRLDALSTEYTSLLKLKADYP